MTIHLHAVPCLQMLTKMREIEFFNKAKMNTVINSYTFMYNSDSNCLIFESTDNSREAFTLMLENIIQCSKRIGTVIYLDIVVKRKDQKWRLETKKIVLENAKLVNDLNDIITRYICSQQRPRRLAFILNPKSGKCKSIKTFERIVKPILKKLDISFTVAVTHCTGDARSISASYTQHTCDAIVVSGGDGTVNEVAHGILINSNNLKKNKVPLGIVPSGTSNNFAYVLYGTIDPVTSILHIVLGIKKSVDIATVKDYKNRLFAVGLSIISYGYLSDSIKFSEKIKFLPKSLPYAASFTWKLLGMRKYSCSGSYDEIVNNDPYDGIQCGATCKKCSQTINLEKSLKNFNESKIFNLQVNLHSGECKLSPKGASPYAHMADGCMDLLIMGDISLSQASKIMQEASKKNGDTFSQPGLEAYRIKRLQLSTEEHSSIWMIDGELFRKTYVDIESHKEYLTVFGSGIQRL